MIYSNPAKTSKKHNFKHRHMIANCASNKTRERSNSAALNRKRNICTEMWTNERWKGNLETQISFVDWRKYIWCWWLWRTDGWRRQATGMTICCETMELCLTHSHSIDFLLFRLLWWFSCYAKTIPPEQSGTYVGSWMFDTRGCRDYGWSNWQTCDQGWITTVESLIAGCLIGTITNGNFTVTKGDRKRLQITRTIIEVTITGYLPKGTRNLHDYDN